jgi:ABC-type transport system involved in multi-copper enzyme maturation permease subunit
VIAVLERDFVAGAVRGRAFVLRALVAVLVAVVAGMVFVDNPSLGRQDPDRLARFVFTGGSCTLLALLALLTPPAVVGAILEERQRGTLPLVLATPIGPRAFAAAKLVARSMGVLTWALAALPALAAVALFGGVGPGQVEDLVLLSVAVVVEMAAWGVAVSAVAERLPTAVVMAYLLPLLRWGVVAFLAGATIADGPLEDHMPEDREARLGLWLALDSTPAGGIWRMAETAARERQIRETLEERQTTVRRFSRVMFRGHVVPVQGIPMGGAVPAPPPAPVFVTPLSLRHPSFTHLAVALAAALAAILFAGRRLAREAEPRTSAAARWLRRRGGARTPPDGGNPMAWKEQRLLNTAASRPVYYAAHALMASATLLFVLLRGGIVLRNQEFYELGLGIVAGNATLVGLVGAVAGAAAVAHERTTGTLDLLRASPLTATEVLRGKAGGLLRGLGFIALFPLLHLVVFTDAEGMNLPVAACGVLVTGVLLALGAGLGMLAGVEARSTGNAVARGVGAYAALLVGLPAVGAVAEIGFRARDLVDLVMTGCPPITAYFLLDGAGVLLNTEGLRDLYWQWRTPSDLPDEYGLALAWFVGFSVFAVAWIPLAVRAFERRLARDREEG